MAMCLGALQRSFLIAWKVLVEGLQHPTLTLYGQFRLDLFTVIDEKRLSHKAHVFAIHEEIPFSIRLL
jgi:hypothetical protein